MNLLLVAFSGFVGTIIIPIQWRMKFGSANTICSTIICLITVFVSLKDIDFYVNVMLLHFLQFVTASFTFGYVFVTFLHYYNYIEARFL
jgi:hypothetical protein